MNCVTYECGCVWAVGDVMCDCRGSFDRHCLVHRDKEAVAAFPLFKDAEISDTSLTECETEETLVLADSVARDFEMLLRGESWGVSEASLREYRKRRGLASS